MISSSDLCYDEALAKHIQFQEPTPDAWRPSLSEWCNETQVSHGSRTQHDSSGMGGFIDLRLDLYLIHGLVLATASHWHSDRRQ